MTAADRPRFAVLMAALAIPLRQEVTEPLIEGYWLGLDDLPITAVERAVKRAAKECRFLPAVADLRVMAGAPRRAVAWLEGTGVVRTLPALRKTTARERGWPDK